MNCFRRKYQRILPAFPLDTPRNSHAMQTIDRQEHCQHSQREQPGSQDSLGSRGRGRGGNRLGSCQQFQLARTWVCPKHLVRMN